jgi:hypothetical protein
VCRKGLALMLSKSPYCSPQHYPHTKLHSVLLAVRGRLLEGRLTRPPPPSYPALRPLSLTLSSFPRYFAVPDPSDTSDHLDQNICYLASQCSKNWVWRWRAHSDTFSTSPFSTRTPPLWSGSITRCRTAMLIPPSPTPVESDLLLGSSRPIRGNGPSKPVGTVE